MATIESQVEELERRALELQPDVGRTAMLAQAVLELKRASDSLVERAGQVRAQGLSDAIFGLESDLELLRRNAAEAQGLHVSEPPLVDVRWTTLAAPGRAYARRNLSNVKYILVEHTATLGDAAPECLARMHVEQGKPAIACHFLVGRDGTVYWTQPVEVAVSHTLVPEINRDSISVSLAGNFQSEAPGRAQLEAAAGLLAWLVSIFELDLSAIRGRREVEAVSSPGAQWLSGTGYKQTLLTLVRECLNGHPRRSSLQTPIIRPHANQMKQTAGRVARPDIIDVVNSLPRHPTLPPYPNRPVPLSAIAIHHTDTSKTMTVQQLAQYHVFGVRYDVKGRPVKAQWPGIGYHFVIAPDGTIYQTQREQTQSYHVGGNANGFCLGIAFIGRFMQYGYNGKLQPAEDQIPSVAQLRSGGQLVAWLIQEFSVAPAKVLGHKNVVGGATACPGEHWEAGLMWRDLLQKEIQATIGVAQECEGNQPMEHYLLFWDHGSSWAAGDWRNAQDYIAHFRPTTGFSVADALQARHVTIVGGPSGVSAADEARLRAACVQVRRLSGADEAATKAMLDALVANNTPWPDAPPRVPNNTPDDTGATDDEDTGEYEPDEWTVPEDWEQLVVPPSQLQSGVHPMEG